MNRTSRKKQANNLWDQYGCICQVAIVFMILVAGITLGLNAQKDNSTPTNTNTNTNTSTSTTTTTTTDTTTTTTTTTPPVVDDFTWKAMWDYQPIMAIDPPSWILIEVFQDDDLGSYCDGVYMFNENTWYDPAYTFHFEVGTTYRVYIRDSAGFEFELEGEPYIVITPGLYSYGWDLISSSDDWGNLMFEWVVI